MTADEAFDAYEAVRHRLPEARTRRREVRWVETLEGVAQDYDAFLLDAFGVLNIGETAIDGTRERIEALRAAGKPVLVVSNAAGLPHDALVSKYRRLGYDFASDEIITSRTTLLARLGERRRLRWGLMASGAAGMGDLKGVTATLLEDDPGPYDEADGFLLIGSADWSDARQGRLERALRGRPRPVLVGNPDIAAPRESGFSAEPGFFAHRLADRIGVAPEFFGKPFADIFDLALERLSGIDRARVLMVGDGLHTDILGAQAAGLASALVTGYGMLAGCDAPAAIDRSGITPDIVLTRP